MRYLCWLSAVEAATAVKRPSMRGLSTSTIVLKDNPEWKRMKREEKERRDANWRRRKNTNPFAQNVGLAR